ncbi:hypothetical protein E2C01_010365 [Portunus trituberculatus]|uniref:Uncharacterized protein n=1 Tax=Portunus trituberculatus TaxID=210409 RepID=A0A5B7D892_PORTR|nr:hypothetical protein [Portunus trituberculatus]
MREEERGTSRHLGDAAREVAKSVLSRRSGMAGQPLLNGRILPARKGFLHPSHNAARAAGRPLAGRGNAATHPFFKPREVLPMVEERVERLVFGCLAGGSKMIRVPSPPTACAPCSPPWVEQ